MGSQKLYRGFQLCGPNPCIVQRSTALTSVWLYTLVWWVASNSKWCWVSKKGHNHCQERDYRQEVELDFNMLKEVQQKGHFSFLIMVSLIFCYIKWEYSLWHFIASQYLSTWYDLEFEELPTKIKGSLDFEFGISGNWNT